jgi:hypothetical protein
MEIMELKFSIMDLEIVLEATGSTQVATEAEYHGGEPSILIF